jgi:hypothetical protein
MRGAKSVVGLLSALTNDIVTRRSAARRRKTADEDPPSTRRHYGAYLMAGSEIDRLS